MKMATDDETKDTQDTTPPKTPDTTPPAKTTETQPAQTGDDKRFTQADLDRVIQDRVGRADTKAEERILELMGLDSLDALKTVVEAKLKSDQDQLTELEKVQAEVDTANQARLEALNQLETVKAQQLTDGRKIAFNDAVRKGGANNVQDLFLLMTSQMGDSFGLVFADESTMPDDSKMTTFIKEVQQKFPLYFGTSGGGSPSNSDGLSPTQADLVKEAEQEYTKRLRK